MLSRSTGARQPEGLSPTSGELQQLYALWNVQPACSCQTPASVKHQAHVMGIPQCPHVNPPIQCSSLLPSPHPTPLCTRAALPIFQTLCVRPSFGPCRPFKHASPPHSLPPSCDGAGRRPLLSGCMGRICLFLSRGLDERI